MRERLVGEQGKPMRGLELESTSHSHRLASLAEGSSTLASFADGFDPATNNEKVLAG